jgi:hypothetical protein
VAQREFGEPLKSAVNLLPVKIAGGSLVVSALALLLAGGAHALPFTHVQIDDPTVTNGDGFGSSVAIDGNNVVVGAPGNDSAGIDANVGQAYRFDLASGGLLQTYDDPTITIADIFGTSVAIFGNNVVVGAPSDDTNGANIGQAHIFDATTGNVLHTLDDPTVTTSDFFGNSVAIDGNNVLVGAHGDDTNGVGNANIGQAHLFDATTGNLVRTFDDPTITVGDNFGFSVAIDGNNALIGAFGDNSNGSTVGQAYLFDIITGNLLRTFDDPTVTSGDQFGVSVAIDGGNVLIGALRDDSGGVNVGQAHLFDAATGNLLRTFDDPTPTSQDHFGHAVAISGDRVLIGAPLDDTNSEDAGQAHLFDAVTGALLQTFNDPVVDADLETGDHFGTALAMVGDDILIGEARDDTNGFNVGQVYHFSASAVPIPEPGSLSLISAGLAGIGFVMWRRRTKRGGSENMLRSP